MAESDGVLVYLGKKLACHRPCYLFWQGDSRGPSGDHADLSKPGGGAAFDFSQRPCVTLAESRPRCAIMECRSPPMSPQTVAIYSLASEYSLSACWVPATQ